MISETLLIQDAQRRVLAMTPAQRASYLAQLNARPPEPEPEPEPEPRDLSQSDRIVVALAQAGEPLTLAELVVVAWKAWPRVFGLRGFESDYPCSNTVRAALFGKHGPLAKGRIKKRGERYYAAPGD